MPDFEYELVFEVTPSLEKSENIGGYFFEVGEKGKTTVKIQASDSIPVGSVEYSYDLEKLSQDATNKIRNLLLRNMIYRCEFDSIKIKYLSFLNTNKEDLEQSGIKLLSSIHRDLVILCNILAQANFIESEEFWNSSFTGVMKEREDDIIRIADWYERSATEADPIKSFILSWIAFNGTYGLWASIWTSIKNKQYKDDAAKFTSMLKSLIDGAQAQDILQRIGDSTIKEFEGYGIKSENGKTDYGIRLKNEKDNEKRLEYVIRCVYGVRNQVFHQALKPAEIMGRVKTAKTALRPVGLLCLKNMLTNN